MGMMAKCKLQLSSILAAGCTTKCKVKAFTKMRLEVTKVSFKLDTKKAMASFFITMEKFSGANFL